MPGPRQTSWCAGTGFHQTPLPWPRLSYGRCCCMDPKVKIQLHEMLLAVVTEGIVLKGTGDLILTGSVTYLKLNISGYHFGVFVEIKNYL